MRIIKTRLPLGMEINFVLPRAGKGFGVEIFNQNKNQYFPLSFPEVKRANTFLQCDSKDYLFYEFWTDDAEKIDLAFTAIKNYFES